MTVLLFFVLMQLAWTYGASSGGGAYSYSDSTGNRVSGTYDLSNGRIIQTSGNPLPARFADTALPGFPHSPFPGFAGRKGFNHFPTFPNFAMPYFPNSAFAGSALGPGFRRQMAAINPANPNSPNVNINRISHYSDTPGNGYKAVSSRSYASSSNINGQEVSRRGAETIVDDNGRVTQYKVEN